MGDIPSTSCNRGMTLKMRIKFLAGVLALVLALVLSGNMDTALSAPKADLWKRWTAHQPGATGTIGYGAWDRFLKTYVKPVRGGANEMRYGRVSQADRGRLKAFLKKLSGVPVSSYARDEQAAYWINLYNALTVDLVLDHFPVRSIRDIDISPGLFSDGPWDRKLIRVEGEAVSLNDIEHRILRPIWRDARVHYALNCASVGCPDLQPSAFTADRLSRQLTGAARDYVNSDRGVRIARGRLTVSSIYHWYKSDFGGNDAGVIAHLKRYASKDLARALSGFDRIHDHRYDWTLNGR